jgi:TolA-binding protein
MIAKLKLAAYVVLVALAIWFGREFYLSYTKIGREGGGGTNAPPELATNAGPEASTNTAVGQTNAVVPALPLTVVTNQSTNNEAATNNAAGSNVVQSPVAPAMPATNAAGSNAVVAAVPTAASGVIAANAGEGGFSVKYLLAFVGALAGLAVLIAYDMTQLVGARVVDYLFDDRGEGMRDPEYERAEQTWVNGKPLEAIEMMREYLKTHPREQFVALRIAEIYEKDLHNYIAAALECEEVLKKKLPAERWGWTAIHLCNLYSRQGRQVEAKTLLQRIARDYPKTSAARKARRNLGLPDTDDEEEAAPAAEPAEPTVTHGEGTGEVFDLDQMIAASDEKASAPPAKAGSQASSPPEPPKSNLPPGFRKKE